MQIGNEFLINVECNEFLFFSENNEVSYHTGQSFKIFGNRRSTSTNKISEC